MGLTVGLGRRRCSAPAVAGAHAATGGTEHGGGGAADPWPQFTAHFLEAYFKANPFFAVQAGRHEFDGQMPDLSAAGIAAQLDPPEAAARRSAGLSGGRTAAPERLEREQLYTHYRQRPVLARAGAHALPQPRLVHRAA